MAAPAAETSITQHKVYVTTPGDTKPGARTALAATKTAVATNANLLKGAQPPVSMSKTGNNFTFVRMGEGTESSIPEPAGLPDLTIDFIPVEANSPDKELLAATIGKWVEVLVLKTEGSNEVGWYAYGKVSGTSTEFSTGSPSSVTLALAAAPARFV